MSSFVKVDSVYLATQNEHKIVEFDGFLRPFGLNVLPLPAGIAKCPENGVTFEANVMEKASYYAQYCDGFVLADDSGICVDALGGKPGVHSARFAGPDGTDEDMRSELLRQLESIEARMRSAQMVSVVSLWSRSFPVGIVARGEIEGMILDHPRGVHGFGYDPLFFVPSLGKTLSEIPTHEKNRISHRAKALSSLVNTLEKLGMI